MTRTYSHLCDLYLLADANEEEGTASVAPLQHGRVQKEAGQRSREQGDIAYDYQAR